MSKTQSFGRKVSAQLLSQAEHFSQPDTEPWWHQIPNKLTVGIALAFFAFAAFVAMPLDTVLWHTGLAVAVLVGMAMFVPVGAGVIKLIAAVILWLGFPAGAVFVLLSNFSCAAAIYVGRLFGRDKDTMPYLPFAVGAVIVIIAFGGLPAELHF